jgi:ATP-dependent helicase/nuclease subunit B
MAAALLREAIAFGADLGWMPAHAAPRVLLKLMDEREVPPMMASGDARVAIWGLLEARLQRRDLMVLAGLNEGVWPAPPGDDPFLSRTMRAKLGLPSLDQRIGLAAHDFAQLANAPNVMLTRALRRDGSPTIASRWLWRLQTLVKGAHAEIESANIYIDWAQAIDHPASLHLIEPPAPRPPADQRLKKISVTTVETLIRDPYAVYARRLMGLESLRPIGAPPGPQERGTAVHAAIEAFGDGDDAQKLLDLLDQELRLGGISPERRAAERERLVVSVNALIAWLKSRRGADVHRELRGELQVGDVLLSGVADRIEIKPDYAAILDFKTGAPPTDKQVDSGLSPQLLLEAAMLEQGAFPGVPKRTADELIYWRFGNAEPTPRSVNLEDGVPEAARAALKALQALLERYAAPEQAFYSKPRVLKVTLYDDYDHLARRKEWADEKADE